MRIAKWIGFAFWPVLFLGIVLANSDFSLPGVDDDGEVIARGVAVTLTGVDEGGLGVDGLPMTATDSERQAACEAAITQHRSATPDTYLPDVRECAAFEDFELKRIGEALFVADELRTAREAVRQSGDGRATCRAALELRAAAGPAGESSPSPVDACLVVSIEEFKQLQREIYDGYDERRVQALS